MPFAVPPLGDGPTFGPGFVGAAFGTTFAGGGVFAVAFAAGGAAFGAAFAVGGAAFAVGGSAFAVGGAAWFVGGAAAGSGGAVLGEVFGAGGGALRGACVLAPGAGAAACFAGFVGVAGAVAVFGGVAGAFAAFVGAFVPLPRCAAEGALAEGSCGGFVGALTGAWRGAFPGAEARFAALLVDARGAAPFCFGAGVVFAADFAGDFAAAFAGAFALPAFACGFGGAVALVALFGAALFFVPTSAGGVDLPGLFARPPACFAAGSFPLFAASARRASL